MLLDATQTDYIDPDILAFIREYRDETAPARNIQLSMVGFHESYELHDDIQFADYSTRELQDKVTPEQVVEFLRQGNDRFVQGRRLNRDLARQVGATARGQHPLAVVLSCIDSRTPAELVFDMGLGDILSVRVAGNVLRRRDTMRRLVEERRIKIIGVLYDVSTGKMEFFDDDPGRGKGEAAA